MIYFQTYGEGIVATKLNLASPAPVFLFVLATLVLSCSFPPVLDERPRSCLDPVEPILGLACLAPLSVASFPPLQSDRASGD